MVAQNQFKTIDLITVGLCINYRLSEADADKLKTMPTLESINLDTVRVRVNDGSLENMSPVVSEIDTRIIKRTLEDWIPSAINPGCVYRTAAHEYIGEAIECARQTDKAGMEQAILISLGYAIKGGSPMDFIEGQHAYARAEYNRMMMGVNILESLGIGITDEPDSTPPVSPSNN